MTQSNPRMDPIHVQLYGADQIGQSSVTASFPQFTQLRGQHHARCVIPPHPLNSSNNNNNNNNNTKFIKCHRNRGLVRLNIELHKIHCICTQNPPAKYWHSHAETGSRNPLPIYEILADCQNGLRLKFHQFGFRDFCSGGMEFVSGNWISCECQYSI